MIEKQIRIFNKQAALYEKKRMKHELGAYRARLLSEARGRVLELGVGAGANLPYYLPEVDLTAVDFSPAMLEKARAANERLYRLQAQFVQGDVHALSLPEQSFDTVVSTLSLCAYQDPEGVIHNLYRWCKPGGRVLLMEHGLSAYKAISWAQHAIDPIAYRFAGCHQNRDIMGLIRRSPLVIEKEEHYMAGMLHLIWCLSTENEHSDLCYTKGVNKRRIYKSNHHV